MIDADLQASLFRHRQRERDAARTRTDSVEPDMLDTSDHKRLVSGHGQTERSAVSPRDYRPGNLNDRNLAYIYQSADTAIIPISFDADNCGRHRHIRQGSEVGVISRPDFHPQPNQLGREEGGRDTATGTDNRVSRAGRHPLHRW